MRKIAYLMLWLLFSTLLAVAQDQKITGRIVNASGQPVEGASVLVKGSSRGVTTNANGVFTITAAQGATLVISSVGFSSQEVSVTGQPVSLTLTEAADAGRMADVVVVGYGTQRRANLTGSVSQIRGEELTKRQVASTSTLLQGLAPGVTVQQQSGKPGGDGAGIRIRGIGSINAGTFPLVLVDNVEMSIDAIDPNAIESITVLKDAASTAIFGARAANGVILVTTKRGRKGTQVGYNSFVSFQRATNLPDKLGPVDHMLLYNEMLVNSNKPKAFTDALIQAYRDNPADNFRYFNTDWINGVLTNNGLMHNHNLTLSSGTDKINFFASGTFLNQQGLTPNTSFRKYDFRINTDVKMSEKMTFRTDIVYNNSRVLEPGGTSPEFIIRQALGIPAIGPGKFGPGQYGDAGQSNNRNPIGQVEASGFDQRTTPSLILKGSLIFRPISNLEFEGFVSANTFNTNSKVFLQNYSVYKPDLVNNSLNFAGLYPGINSINESYSNGSRMNYLAQGTYSKAFGDSRIKFLTGFQAEEYRIVGLSAARDSLINNNPYINNAVSTSRRNSGGASEYALAGVFGRLNYTFRDRYLLEVNGRYDGSSRFNQERDRQWGFFPSVSAGWVISEEAFFGGLRDKISFLKLRGSHGSLGNQNVPGFYPFAAVFNTGQNYYFNGVTNSGYAQLNAANPDVTWEKSIQSNIGIDMNLFRNKLSITADVFERRLKDMLLTVPVPIWLGQNSPLLNAGSMTNRGWELGITHRNQIGKFKYDVTGNLSDVKNKVTSLSNQELVNGLFISRVGHPLNSYYGYIAEGLFQSDAEVAAAPTHSPTTKAGDIRYRDISGPQGKPDGKIDQLDRTILGHNFPRYEYSLNLNGAYSGFDINIFFQGVGKRQTYVSGTGAWPFFAGDFIATAFEFHKDRWTPDNPNASFPRLTDGVGINYANSSYWMQNGAYLRLKNLQIGYTLPARFNQIAKIQSARFFVSGQNLFTWDNYFPGFDPEKNEQNGEFYPIMKTMTVGLNIRF